MTDTETDTVFISAFKQAVGGYAADGVDKRAFTVQSRNLAAGRGVGFFQQTLTSHGATHVHITEPMFFFQTKTESRFTVAAFVLIEGYGVFLYGIIG